jgi:hydrogenase/urease accessory protein HupE
MGNSMTRNLYACLIAGLILSFGHVHGQELAAVEKKATFSYLSKAAWGLGALMVTYAFVTICKSTSPTTCDHAKEWIFRSSYVLVFATGLCLSDYLHS